MLSVDVIPRREAALIFSLLQWEKVDFAKQKTDEVVCHHAVSKGNVRRDFNGIDVSKN